jgi:hypothetical protein
VTIAQINHLERWVRRARRRLLWQRRLERMRLALAAGGAAGLVLSLLLLGLGRPSLIAAGAILVVAAAAGLVWAAGSGVSTEAAAQWADGRFHLRELLATAWALRAMPAADEPWRRTILALADARCRELEATGAAWPGLLCGRRAWSVVGLCIVAIFTISSWPAAEPSPSPSVPAATAAAPTLAAPTSANAVHRPTLQQDRPPGGPVADAGFNRPDNAAPASADQSAAGQSGGASHRLGSGGDQSSAATGGGLSRTATPMNSMGRPRLTAGLTPSAPGNQAAGGGLGTAPDGTSAQVGGRSSGQKQLSEIPPWQSPQWPVDRQAAFQAIQAGQINPAYQDLVRDYFQPS